MKDIDDLVRNQLRRDADGVRFEPDRWEERLTSGRARPRTPHIRAVGTVIAALLLAVGIVVPLAVVSRLRDERSVVPAQTGPAPEHRRHIDLDAGLAIKIPAEWTFREDPTRPTVIEPENVFGVGSWPFPTGGVCAPFDALDDVPPDGVFLWLIEYHGTDNPAGFVPRPDHFDLADFRYGETACYAPTPQYQLRFQEEGRYFQWQVAFGPEASEVQEERTVQALDSFEVLTPECPARESYEPTIAPAAGPPGTVVQVSGPIATGGSEGGGWGAPLTRLEAWWNLDPDEWFGALTGNPVGARPGPVEILGRWFADGGCVYAIRLRVPEVPAGTYPVVLVGSGPDLHGPSSSARAVWFEVTG
jgi:hypothetical protein